MIRLTFELPRRTWKAGEAIDGLVTLAYEGQDVAQISGSGGGLFGFSFVEVGGTRAIWPVWQDDCHGYDLPADRPMTTGILLSGGWDAGDPNAPFMHSTLTDSVLRLPAGTWDITAIATFVPITDCAAPQEYLRATIRVEVTE